VVGCYRWHWILGSYVGSYQCWLVSVPQKFKGIDSGSSLVSVPWNRDLSLIPILLAYGQVRVLILEPRKKKKCNGFDSDFGTFSSGSNSQNMKIHKLEILKYLFYNRELVQMFEDFKQNKNDALSMNSKLYLMFFQVSSSKTKHGIVQKKFVL